MLADCEHIPLIAHRAPTSQASATSACGEISGGALLPEQDTPVLGARPLRSMEAGLKEQQGNSGREITSILSLERKAGFTAKCFQDMESRKERRNREGKRG